MSPQHAHTLRTVWIALASLQVVFLLLPFLPLPVELGRHESLGELFPILLALIAVGEGIAVHLLFRARVLRTIQDGRLDPATEGGFQRLYAELIVLWSLALSIAMYGTLLGLLDYPVTWRLPFAAAAALLFYLTRPEQPALQPRTTSALV